MEPSEPKPRHELRTLASNLPLTDPDIQRFVEVALDEIERLRSQQAAAEHNVAVSNPKGMISPERSAHQHDLLLEQLAEITELRARLARAEALCDLAEWAAESTRGALPSVQVSDLRKAIKPDI
jgi:hypothetical protein